MFREFRFVSMRGRAWLGLAAGAALCLAGAALWSSTASRAQADAPAKSPLIVGEFPPPATAPQDLPPEERLQRYEAVKLWLDTSGDPARAVALAARRVAEFQAARGESDKAIAFLRETLKDLNSVEANLTVRQILAETLLQAGRVDEAIAEYQALVLFAKRAQ